LRLFFLIDFDNSNCKIIKTGTGRCCCICAGWCCMCTHQMAALLHEMTSWPPYSESDVNRCIFCWKNSCHISSWSDLKWQSLKAFEEVVPTIRRRTTGWVAIWDQFLIQKNWLLTYDTGICCYCIKLLVPSELEHVFLSYTISRPAENSNWVNLSMIKPVRWL